MKQALAYIRISDDEQSHFSIEAQHRHIQEYCQRHSITLHQSFTDEGFSAKNFNRPAWIELKSTLDRQRGKFGYLIVYKYDRMIRNAMEGLSQLHELEQKHKLTIISVCENLGLDPHSPYFKKVRADILVNAEFERNVISDRVRTGMNQAYTSGRYLHQAPFGYTNARDEQDKPILSIDPGRSRVVQSIFSDYASGRRMIDIEAMARAAGLATKGKCIIRKILTNPVYAGMVRVTPFRGEPSKLVPGIHEPIVSKELWWAIQSKLESSSKPLAPKVTSEAMPLRGIIKCENGHPFTGCMCAGKSGKKWPYYMCNKCAKKITISAAKCHSDLHDIIQSISISELFDATVKRARQMMDERLRDNSYRIHQLEKTIRDAENVVVATEDKFIRDAISPETYSRQIKRHSETLAAAKSELSSRTMDADHMHELFDQNLHKLADLAAIYEMATIDQKADLIRLIFPQGLIRLKHTYQTPRITSALRLKPTPDAKIEIQENLCTKDSPLGGPWGDEIKPLLQLIQRICA